MLSALTGGSILLRITSTIPSYVGRSLILHDPRLTTFETATAVLSCLDPFPASKLQEELTGLVDRRLKRRNGSITRLI